MDRHPAAPWSTAVTVTSILGSALLTAVAYVGYQKIPPVGGFTHAFGLVVVSVLPAVWAGCALLTVRGYRLDPRQLQVERLLWSTSLPVGSLTRAWHDPLAMKGSLRVMGNGGLFAIVGHLHSPQLGRYRAFATDPKRAVVLVTPRRTIVVTPADPEAFLRHLGALFPGAHSGHDA